jgi:hypothetical protein
VSSFQLDVLTPRQREVLAELGPFAQARGFYLAGGTAVALRLGHRRSEDFDWFAGEPVTLPEDLPPELDEAGIAAATTQIARGTYHGRVKGVSITFLRYRYPMLEEPEFWADYGCRVAALSDLACMKLSAVSLRGERKDFVDLYALLRRDSSLPELLENYRRKFNVSEWCQCFTA